METGFDFILGTSWSRRFRSTETDWATNTLVLKTKCGQTSRVPFIGTTATPRPDPPPLEPSMPTPSPSIIVTLPRQFAHFIRQDDVTFFMVDVTDLLHYDPPCPDAELIPLEPDPPSISMAPISTSVPPPSVESTPSSRADADAEELARYTADLEPAVRDLIREYHGVFPSSFSYAGIPPMRDVEHSIQLVPDYRVHRQAPYRLSIPKATELKRQLEELLRLGFIKRSNSPWGAPVLFARKADGTLHLCIDYRGLNRYTVKNSYPMPRSDELFDRLAGNRFFTKIDLRRGYHQIRVAAADQPKTAFRSRFGHYEFTVMPFGLTNEPATFQRAMNDILRDILEQYVLIYLDDILVYSRTLEEHLRHLRDVLDRLRRHGFYAKLSKCRFAQHKVDFLGHYVSDQGLHMDDAKITAIAEWPAPTSAKQLHSFLGLTSYYSNFIRGYARFPRKMSFCRIPTSAAGTSTLATSAAGTFAVVTSAGATSTVVALAAGTTTATTSTPATSAGVWSAAATSAAGTSTPATSVAGTSTVGTPVEPWPAATQPVEGVEQHQLPPSRRTRTTEASTWKGRRLHRTIGGEGEEAADGHPVDGGDDRTRGGVTGEGTTVGTPASSQTSRQTGRTPVQARQTSIIKYGKNPRQQDIDDSCCEYFVENVIPFNAKSKSFKKFTLACYGLQPSAKHPLVPTGYNPLRCRLLDRLHKRLEDEEPAIRPV
ncbi:hypothetical protein CBR_g32456 [Chara braunii]|uniref:Reverse transcriptase domain-containing protein n=1 Tax=Chara braunii TaxID=69332 RepID=A0A388LGN1_CHABU|nr:hypothetical protein CBR_g32456 [Chara braunii]|eukprot:GBG81466.1 hypothetical protein CBR_g32456 [Chara braunii]